jgi:hypothetical protein
MGRSAALCVFSADREQGIGVAAPSRLSDVVEPCFFMHGRVAGSLFELDLPALNSNSFDQLEVEMAVACAIASQKWFGTKSRAQTLLRWSAPTYTASLTCAQTREITTDPSPTEEATRLTDPARTSPTAKMPRQEVS